MAAFPLPPVAVVVDHDADVVEVEKLLEDPSDQELQVVVDEVEVELGSDQDPHVVVEAPVCVGTTVTVV
jgi:hypothetical protein